MRNVSDGATLAATYRKEVRSLSVVRTERGLAKLALTVTAIVASVLSVALALDHHAPWFFWPFAFLASVWSQYAANEEIHDGAHYRLLNGHRANDLLSGFYAGLIGVPFHEYRATHLIHHRHFGLPVDPDYPKYANPPTSRAGWARYFAMNFSGLAALQRLTGESTTPRDRRTRFGQYPFGCAALQVVLFAVTAYTVSPLWYPLCWLLPLLTLTYGMTQYRVLLEHWRDPTPDDARIGELVNLGGAVQKHVFAGQFGYNRHGTHHLLPSIPNYNLARIDRVLARDDEWTSAVTSTSYLSRARDAFRREQQA